MTVQNIEEIATLSLHFKPKIFSQKLLAWYEANARDLPWRVLWQKTEDPYVVWVSEIMLQQTVIKAVLPAYDRFLQRFPSPDHLAQATEEEVRLASRGLGYYRRFGMLHKAAKVLTHHEKCFEWPSTFQAWKKLPGIGDYTAAAISSICFDQPVPVVDGNVERVFCRLLDIQLEPNLPPLKKAFFQFGLRIIPHEIPGDYNQAVMELGQTVCTKQSPNCSVCPVQKQCLAFKNQSQDLAPKTKKSMVYEDVTMQLVIPRRANQLGIIKRPGNAKFLKETWGFPTRLEQAPQKFAWDGDLDWRVESLETEIGSVKHSITKHKISSAVYLADHHEQEDLRWIDLDEIESQLVSNLDRKALKLLKRKLKSQVLD